MGRGGCWCFWIGAGRVFGGQRASGGSGCLAGEEVVLGSLVGVGDAFAVVGLGVYVGAGVWAQARLDKAFGRAALGWVAFGELGGLAWSADRRLWGSRSKKVGITEVCLVTTGPNQRAGQRKGLEGRRDNRTVTCMAIRCKGSRPISSALPVPTNTQRHRRGGGFAAQLHTPPPSPPRMKTAYHTAPVFLRSGLRHDVCGPLLHFPCGL